MMSNAGPGALVNARYPLRSSVCDEYKITNEVGNWTKEKFRQIKNLSACEESVYKTATCKYRGS